MTEQIRHIMIVGGGTSGWLVAAYLKNNLPPQVKLSLIESTKIGPIGVGEGTQPFTMQFLREAGITPEMWMKDASATYKLGVEFVGWHDQSYFVDNDTYETFVIGPNTTTMPYWADKGTKQFFDWLPSYRLAKANKSPKLSPELDHTPGLVSPSWDAVHFNAFKIGDTLRQMLKNKIDYYDTEIVEVDKNDHGIEKLRDVTGREYIADLYIDCSGFKSILLEQALGETFIDCNDVLLCNRAVAMPTQYKNKETEMFPYTRATTMNYGWRWTIPISERVGNGYVYSDLFISPEQAELELRQSLGDFTTPVNHLSMKIGYHKEIAKQNVLAVGLSAGFVEPLEATGITFTTKAVHFLMEALVKSNGVWDQRSRNLVNTQFETMFSEIVDFIFLHYKLSNKKDTDFWQAYREMPMPEAVQKRLEFFSTDFPKQMFMKNNFQMFHTGQWFEMLLGSGYFKDRFVLLDGDYAKYADMYIDYQRYKTDKVLNIFPNHSSYIAGLYDK